MHDKDWCYIRDMYNKAIFPLYERLGPHTDTFDFSNYCDGMDAFRKFNDCGRKLKQLTVQSLFKNNILFLEELVQSQQSKSIQRLVLKDITPAPLEMMLNMEALTFLEIDCSTGYSFNQEKHDESHTRTVNFDQLFAACSAKLTHLTIKGVKLAFNESISNKISIRFLKLVNADITSAAAITETSLLKLTALHLETTITNNLTMSLPGKHLKKVDIHIKCPKKREYGLSVNTVCEDKPHSNLIWPTRERGTGRLLYGSNKPISKSAAKNMVDLTCASIEQMS